MAYQGFVIKQLNEYFKWNNLPIKMDEEGICNGLAKVHAKYVLEGREELFMKMLESIAKGVPADLGIGRRNMNQEFTSIDLDLFITDVLLAYNPQVYDPRLRQSISMEMLKVEGKKLESCFGFAMVSTDEGWVKAFKQLEFQKNELVQICSINHAISLHKVGSKYRVYDPNYFSGYKEFANEEQLIRELHDNVFKYAPGNLGLSIQVIRHPNADKRATPFPTAEEIYENCLSDINASVVVKDKTYSSLTMVASEVTDIKAARYLLLKIASENLNVLANDDASEEEVSAVFLKSEENIFESALSSVRTNNYQILLELMDSLNNLEKNQRLKLILSALILNRKEIFFILLEKEAFKKTFDDDSDLLIQFAFQGGNPELVEFCVNRAQKVNVERYNLNLVMNKKELMETAIDSGNAKCMQILYEQLKIVGRELNQQERMSYLRYAIEKNQYFAALELMDCPVKLEREVLGTIQIDEKAASQLNITLLLKLEERGVTFTKTAENLIRRKETQVLTIWQSIGLMISRFTDFIKERFSIQVDTKETNELSDNSNKRRASYKLGLFDSSSPPLGKEPVVETTLGKKMCEVPISSVYSELRLI